MLSGMQKNVKERTLTLPNELPFCEFESQWTSESLEGNCRGQNSLDWKVFYIIGKVFERRCLKWLTWPIWTHKTQVMAKRRAKSQIGNLIPQHYKSRIAPISLRASGLPYVVGKLLTRATTLLKPHFNRRSAHKVMGPQSYGSPSCGNLETPTWES